MRMGLTISETNHIDSLWFIKFPLKKNDAAYVTDKKIHHVHINTVTVGLLDLRRTYI